MVTIGCPPGCAVVFLNALVSELERTLYLPSLTEEMAYMTTKKAKSSVMKSA